MFNLLYIRNIISSFLIFALLLSGCSKHVDTSSLLLEIEARSQAARFLAEKVEQENGFISSIRKDNTVENAYIYDNALAAIVLTFAGAYEHAQCIADALVFVQEHDRTFKDGRIRNVYIAGDPKSDSGRSIIEGNVTVRLPGFWQDGKWQEDAYTVSTSTGNIAWVILALCIVSIHSDSEQRHRYIQAAIKAADFVLTLESELGFTAGYEGWDDAQTKASYISTEHNIDLYVAFSVLSKLLSETNPSKAQVYEDASQKAKRFAFAMYDSDLGCFYTGTTDEKGTISEGVIPLDTSSLAILAFGEEIEQPYMVISFIEKRMSVGGGFDYSAGDLDGIWNEGTAQMAVCYHVLNHNDRYESLMKYLKTQIAQDGSIPAADRDNVSTGFVIAGTDTLWEYNNEQSISATAWLALAQLEMNPFDVMLD